MIIEYLLTILIVGFVTAGLGIRFDRFFTILLLLFIFKFSIFESVNIFLWVIMFGALYLLFANKDKLLNLPNDMKKKLFIVVPIFTSIATFLGTLLYINSGAEVLIATLGVLAILYGLRLMFIHFKEYELKYEKAHPGVKKMCGLFGPWISGFLIGFIGTSLKPLKIPFAVKVGKMNVKQVYVSNAVTAFYSSVFAIIWHYVLSNNITSNIFYKDMILGMALFVGIHFVFEFTDLLFKDKWKKGFQITIGFLLLLASIKIFLLI